MNPHKRTLLWVNALGGTAVLGSYAWSLSAHSGAGGEFWGGVPATLQSGYTVTMLLAAAGYFAFTFQTAVLDALVWPAYFPV